MGTKIASRHQRNETITKQKLRMSERKSNILDPDDFLFQPYFDKYGNLNEIRHHNWMYHYGDEEDKAEALEFLGPPPPPKEPWWVKKQRLGQTKLTVARSPSGARKVSFSPKRIAKNSTKNFQGYSINSCVWRDDVQKFCYQPSKYGTEKNCNGIIKKCCKYCYLTPCFLNEKQTIIEERLDGCTKWYKDTLKSGIRNPDPVHVSMAQIVLPTILSGIFSKKYVKKKGLPHCARKYVGCIRDGTKNEQKLEKLEKVKSSDEEEYEF